MADLSSPVPARLTGVLALEGAQLLDIEQVVVRGRLTLSLLISVAEARGVLKELLFAAKELGVELDFEPLNDSAPTPLGPRYVVTATRQAPDGPPG